MSLALLNGCATIAENPITAFPVIWGDKPGRAVSEPVVRAANKPRPVLDLAAAPANNIPSLVPVSHPDLYLSSAFGASRSSGGGGGFHKGVDLICPPGTQIRAAADGEVTFAESMSGYGNLVIVKHGERYASYYAHCQTMAVAKGMKVKRGDVIATVGRTGRASTDHLHYEVRLDGKAVDPIAYLPNADQIPRR